jgi:hypothetical protein
MFKFFDLYKMSPSRIIALGKNFLQVFILFCSVPYYSVPYEVTDFRVRTIFIDIYNPFIQIILGGDCYVYRGHAIHHPLCFRTCE